MGNVAKLFPYRYSNGRLGFRGKVGCKKADGVTEGVSKFFPVRVDGRMLLRGKGPDGKILWGFPYRDENGRLMGETLAGGVPLDACGWPIDAPSTLTLTVSGVSSVNPLCTAWSMCQTSNGSTVLTRMVGPIDYCGYVGWYDRRADPPCSSYSWGMNIHLTLTGTVAAGTRRWRLYVFDDYKETTYTFEKAITQDWDTPIGSYTYVSSTGVAVYCTLASAAVAIS